MIRVRVRAGHGHGDTGSAGSRDRDRDCHGSQAAAANIEIGRPGLSLSAATVTRLGVLKNKPLAPTNNSA